MKVGDCVEVSHLGDDTTHLLQLKALWSEPTQTRTRMQALGQYFYRAEVGVIPCSRSASYYAAVFLLHICVTDEPWARYRVCGTAFSVQCCGKFATCLSTYVALSVPAMQRSGCSTLLQSGMTCNRVRMVGSTVCVCVCVVHRIHAYKPDFQSMRYSVQTSKRQ